MRVGLFTDVYPPYVNGVSTSVLMLKRSLEALGHQVYVVTVNNENMKYKYDEEGNVIRIPGLSIGIYDYRLSGIYPVKSLKKIKKWNLDVIHSHTEFGVGTFARIISKQLKIPLVHTYHTMYEDYVHYITKGYFNGISKKIVEYLTLFYCDQTISELIVPTKKTYDLFKEKYKVNRNIYVIPTGIEVEKFYKENFDPKEVLELRKKVGLKKDDFVLLYVGRIAAEKNMAFLLDAQKALSKKNPNLKLLVVGDGPDLDKHKKETEASSFNNSVIFVGKVPLTEVAKYYQLGDIFVTASQSETQGLTVIEAMASSMPVVCMKDESFMNTVIPDLNGYMFENKREYRKIITDIYNDPDKLRRLKKQARLNGNMHSSKYYGERVSDVYRVAIENYQNKRNNFWDHIKKVVGRNEKNNRFKS
ncbi:MAG TPA: glycosyltransferase family 4 protein [Mollicutes bacterium]|jgi:1,2-diacylglycerol 3-alpha-glucosyltransferase|nr:glycosyltransferase family 4 protein [Mollicutes bacterium]